MYRRKNSVSRRTVPVRLNASLVSAAVGFLCALVFNAGSLQATGTVEAVDGFGPWNFGMTPEQVADVEGHGPYVPVRTTGGLETFHGEFEGRETHTSFVFSDRGLYQVQIWAFSGKGAGEAIRAFHDVYTHLSNRFGDLRFEDGSLVPSGLSLDELDARIPAAFRTGDSESQLGELQERGSIQAQTVKLHLHPVDGSLTADVYGSLLHSPQLGLYWVFVYYKSPAHRR